MRVLFVTSEVAPLIKTGGLADVSAALPAALHEMGVEIRVLLPGYTQVLQALPKLRVAADFGALPVSGLAEFPPCRLLRGKLPSGVPLYVLDCPELYMRDGGAYQDYHGHDWEDNALRFGLFSKVAALLACADSPLTWKPHVVHCNDWQSGLTAAYLQYLKKPAPCVMTVHNLAYQGNFSSSLITALGLPWECYKAEGLEFYGKLSFLKAGLFYAAHISTVSPSYAHEIQTHAMGCGMEGLLSYRREDLTGILNGIDCNEWNPAADSYLAHTYDADKLSGKSANKREMQKRVGLQVDEAIPVFGLVGRFAYQKGVDLVLEVAQALIDLPAQLVMLGSGDKEMQRAALELARRFPGRIAANTSFDEGLAHLIEAGADIFLMPSRFEPCGLNQMYSQRYGTPPLVHATGGLIDTVQDCTSTSLARGQASGFVFNNMDALSLLTAARRAVAVYRDNKSWIKLQHTCMRIDYSWTKSANAYMQIYTRMTQRKPAARVKIA